MTSAAHQERYAIALREWVASRLKALRQERAYTQAQVAELAGMPQPRVAEAESGKQHLHGATLAKLLIVYGLHPAEFFQGAPPPPKRKGQT